MGLAVKPREMIEFLEDNGFQFVSQKGSHKKYFNGYNTTVVSTSDPTIDIGTLKAILNQTGLTRKELEKWLGR